MRITGYNIAYEIKIFLDREQGRPYNVVFWGTGSYIMPCVGSKGQYPNSTVRK